MSDAIQGVREMLSLHDELVYGGMCPCLKCNALRRVLAVAEAAVALHTHEKKKAYSTEAWYDLANDARGLQADYDAAVAALTTTTEGE